MIAEQERTRGAGAGFAKNSRSRRQYSAQPALTGPFIAGDFPSQALWGRQSQGRVDDQVQILVGVDGNHLNAIAPKETGDRRAGRGAGQHL